MSEIDNDELEKTAELMASIAHLKKEAYDELPDEDELENYCSLLAQIATLKEASTNYQPTTNSTPSLQSWSASRN